MLFFALSLFPLTADAGSMFNGMSKQGTDLYGSAIEMVTDSGDVLDVVVADTVKANGVIWYQLTFKDVNVCGEDGWGLFVDGVWDASGNRLDEAVFGKHIVDKSFSCDTGVIAKCVDWGYDPAIVGSDAHLTCTRMARADYCGDGESWTEDGTLIDVFDDLGVWPYKGNGQGQGFSFEAGWGPDGAVCVQKTRYREREDPKCFEELPRCSSWKSALHEGAWLGNASSRNAHTD